MWNKISDVGLPKRGDYSVLVCHVNGSVETCHVDDLHWANGLGSYTHWMPLPAPPNSEEMEQNDRGGVASKRGTASTTNNTITLRDRIADIISARWDKECPEEIADAIIAVIS